MRRSLSFLRGGLDLITIQSNHLLGNLRYTLTECLLANLTDLRFRKNGFESHRSNSTASPDLALKIWSRQKSIMGYPRYFSSELWWKGKFQENTKSLESSSNFQNWHTPEFGKWAVSPPRILCFATRTLSKLYRLAHLFFNMAKLTADLNHDLRTKTHLGYLRHAGDSSRIKGLMMPNLLPGGRKYSSNKLRISVEITSKLCLINR